MSRRATEQELAAARDVASEIKQRGGRMVISLDDLLRTFQVTRFTRASRDRLGEALGEAGVDADPPLHLAERGEGVTLIARQAAPAVATAACAGTKPWHKRKRLWAIAAVLLLLLVGALSGDPDSTTEKGAGGGTPPASITPTPTRDRAAARQAALAAADDALKKDRYQDALAAVVVLDDDHIVDGYERRIARRLLNRARGALRSNAYELAISRARTARDYHAIAGANSVMAAAKTGLAAQRARERKRREAAALARDMRTCDSGEKGTVRAGGATPNGCTDFATKLAADRAAEAAARAAEEAANAVPGYTDDSSSGDGGNWCGATRDGDGDGIWCEGR